MTTYVCEHCDYTTTRKHNFTRHNDTVHGATNAINTHICQYCDKKFTTKSSLQRHSGVNCEKYRELCAQDLAKMRCQHFVKDIPKVDIGDPKVDIVDPKVDIDEPKVEISFPCPTCYKVFETKSGLTRHVCEKISHPNQCPKCLKVLASTSSKSRHVKNCNVVRNDAIPPTTSTINNIHTQTINNIQTQNNQNIHNIQNIQNIQNINIRPLGHEDVSHITTSYKDARLGEYNGGGIYNYIKDVHFNPSLPQNHNVRKYDKNYCTVYGDGEWVKMSLQTVLADLVTTYRFLLNQRLSDPEFRKLKGEDNFWQIYNAFMKFDKDKTPSDYYKVIRDMTALLEQLDRKVGKLQLCD